MEAHQEATRNKKLLGTSASLVVTGALLVVTMCASNLNVKLILLANIVTTSKALVTASVALVTSRKGFQCWSHTECTSSARLPPQGCLDGESSTLSRHGRITLMV